MSKFAADIERVWSRYPASTHPIIRLMNLLIFPGIHAMTAYRLQQWSMAQPTPIRQLAGAVGFVLALLVKILWGIEIGRRATIGAGLYIGHQNAIVISNHCTIGEGCDIFHGVTIGMGSKADDYGQFAVPTIGNHVFIGAGAKIIGGVTIGDHAIVGANAVVCRDVPEGATVVSGGGMRILNCG